MLVCLSTLYRAAHGTFEAYCQKCWQLKQSRAYQLMDAAKVFGNLESSTIVELPRNEAQARELAPLDAQAQQAVWQIARATSPIDKIAARRIAPAERLA